nr:hypothetical protein [uncultured Actinoplanes sp.]
MTDSDDVFLVGGPRGGGRYAAPDTAAFELEIDGLYHRYLRTDATRESDGETLCVYNYDGVVRPRAARTAD